MASNTSRPDQGNENPTTEKLDRLLIAADGASALIYCAANKIGNDSDSPERIIGISKMLSDIADELRALAAGVEG